MNKNILSTGVQNFIKENWNTDIVSLLLKKPIFGFVSNQELARQLEARKKCEKKLPTWFGTPNIYYPNKLTIEQTSSERTARYKSEIVAGKSLLDLTGGFGVDSYYFSQTLEQVVHCEIDEELSHIAHHNFQLLGAKNIQTKSIDGMEFLRESAYEFDWIYIDPSRRTEAGGKVFRLSDCAPNVLNELELLEKKSKNILIKTSPLLDFSIGISELKMVKEIYVVATNNEVKELLWILGKGHGNDITVKTINLLARGTQTFNFRLSEEKLAIPRFSMPLTYVYEPNAAILKSGAFQLLGTALGCYKLHEHTHLYTFDTLIDFPGRRFKINQVHPYTKKNMKRLANDKANVSTRNFPESVAELRRKFRIGDGGNVYLFFVTVGKNERVVMICEKAS